jgi:hypothetical protein
MAIGALRAGNVAVVEAAIDHLNRIVTPFSAPWVRTVSIGWGELAARTGTLPTFARSGQPILR